MPEYSHLVEAYYINTDLDDFRRSGLELTCQHLELAPHLIIGREQVLTVLRKSRQGAGRPWIDFQKSRRKEYQVLERV